MRTSGKLTPGGAMRLHSASLTVFVVGTMRPNLLTVTAFKLGDAIEAHERAEGLEFIQRHGDFGARAGALQLAVSFLQRRAHREETEGGKDCNAVAQIFQLGL